MSLLSNALYKLRKQITEEKRDDLRKAQYITFGKKSEQSFEAMSEKSYALLRRKKGDQRKVQLTYVPYN